MLWGEAISESMEQFRTSLDSSVTGTFCSFVNSAQVPMRSVTLRPEGPSGPGMSIMGGSEHDMPIVISKIFPGQAADRCGDIHEGDQIVEINGVNVESTEHRDVVNLLKSDTVTMVLRKYMPVSRGSISSISNPSLHGGGSFRTSRGATGSRPLRSTVIEESTSSPATAERDVQQWSTFRTIPLQRACVSRRMVGTGKLQPNSFHIVTASHDLSPVFYCTEESELAQWCSLLRTKIEALDQALIVEMNASLAECDKIIHFGWVAERQTSTEQWKNYVHHFMLLTSKRVLLYESPPMSSEQLSRPVSSFPLLSTHCNEVQTDRQQDSWPHCFTLTAADGQSLYMASESRAELATWFQRIWQATVNQALDESCMFTGTYRQSSVELSVSLQNQLTLADGFDKTVIWRKPFSQLSATSCDDNSVVFSFSDAAANTGAAEEATDYEVSFSSCHAVLHTVHNMLLALVSTLDPNIIKEPMTV
eukprot:scpid37390/ scgid2640/ Gamma-1-syntrophin; Syntrophin-4